MPSAPPPAAELRPFAFPAFERHRLANGVELLVARVERLPLFNAVLIAAAGAHHNSPTEGGLASMTSALLDDGTVERSATEVARFVEGLGGFLATGVSWDVAFVSCNLLAEHLRPGLEILCEVGTRPTFPEEEVERVRRRRLVEIVRRRDQPSAVASEAFSRLLYGDAPYGCPISGSEESVGDLSRDSMAQFYRRHFVPGGSALIVVGDVEPRRLVGLAEELLGEWSGSPPPAVPRLDAPRLEGTRVRIVDRPNAAQTELRIGHAGVPRQHPDHVPLQVLNSLLGGKFTSRINLNLRERHGYTYGANSRFASRLGPGPFVVYTAVSTEVAGRAVEEIRGELRRIRHEPVDAAELEDTKNYIRGVFPYTIQTIVGLARRLEVLQVYDLPDDYFDRYLERVGQVEPQEILRLARRHLAPDRLAIAAAGPAASLRPQLEPFGPVEVVDAAGRTQA